MAYIGKSIIPITKRQMRRYYIQRFSVAEIAIMYRVPEITVQNIVRGLRKYRYERV